MTRLEAPGCLANSTQVADRFINRDGGMCFIRHKLSKSKSRSTDALESAEMLQSFEYQLMSLVIVGNRHQRGRLTMVAIFRPLSTSTIMRALWLCFLELYVPSNHRMLFDKKADVSSRHEIGQVASCDSRVLHKYFQWAVRRCSNGGVVGA